MKIAQESNEIITGRLYTFTRRLTVDDLDAQVKALQELQQQPGFGASKPVSVKPERGIWAMFRKKAVRVMRWIFGRDG